MISRFLEKNWKIAKWVAVGAVIFEIICVKSIASVTSCVAKLGSEDTLNSAFTYLWEISWNIIQSAVCNSETEAEICIGAFEALCYILKAIASVSSTVSLGLLMESFKSSSPKSEDEPLLDHLFETFLGSINSVIGYGDLVRSRRAVLMNWKFVEIEPIGGDNQPEETTSEQPLSISSQSPCSAFSVASNFFKYEELAAKWIQKGYLTAHLCLRSVSRGDYKFKNSF